MDKQINKIKRKIDTLIPRGEDDHATGEEMPCGSMRKRRLLQHTPNVAIENGSIYAYMHIHVYIYVYMYVCIYMYVSMYLCHKYYSFWF